MRLQFFSISVQCPAVATEELNRFLASQRVVDVQRELIHDGERSCWAVCVVYSDGETLKPSGAKRAAVDYREKLSAPDFAVYAKLRALRKVQSEREGVPAYALFTNDQLAAMVTQRVFTLAALAKISGIGPARIEKYGAAFLELLAENLPLKVDSNEAGGDQS